MTVLYTQNSDLIIPWYFTHMNQQWNKPSKPCLCGAPHGLPFVSPLSLPCVDSTGTFMLLLHSKTPRVGDVNVTGVNLGVLVLGSGFFPSDWGAAALSGWITCITNSPGAGWGWGWGMLASQHHFLPAAWTSITALLSIPICLSHLPCILVFLGATSRPPGGMPSARLRGRPCQPHACSFYLCFFVRVCPWQM